MSGLQKAVLGIGFVVSMLLFLLLVWPTPYRYDHMTVQGNVLPVKTYRLTGKTEFLTPSGWREVDERSNGRQEEQLPSQDLAKITGTYQIENIGKDGRITFQAYNGTEWTVTTIRIEIDVTHGDWHTDDFPRLYDLSPTYPYTHLPPCKSGEFTTDLGFQLQQGDTRSFRIVSARGTK